MSNYTGRDTVAPRRLIKPIERHVTGSIVVIYVIVLAVVVGGFAKIEMQQQDIKKTAIAAAKNTRSNHKLIKANKRLIAALAYNAKLADYNTCVRVNNINVLATGNLERSLANLPKLQYYKDHQNELNDQLVEIKRQLVKFQPRTCTRPKPIPPPKGRG